jgi:hypothetical protein
MAPANRKKQIPFFRYISVLLTVEFSTPLEWGPDLRKLRKDTGITEKYVSIAWYSDHASNLQSTNGKVEVAKGCRLQRGDGEIGTTPRSSQNISKIFGSGVPMNSFLAEKSC